MFFFILHNVRNKSNFKTIIFFITTLTWDTLSSYLLLSHRSIVFFSPPTNTLKLWQKKNYGTKFSTQTTNLFPLVEPFDFSGKWVSEMKWIKVDLKKKTIKSLIRMDEGECSIFFLIISVYLLGKIQKLPQWLCLISRTIRNC